jgi:hypothetical protein
MDTIATHTAAPFTARADIKGIVMIGNQWGNTAEILMALDVPRAVWNAIDAPEVWVGSLSATKTVVVGNMVTTFWMATYAGNDMEIATLDYKAAS